MVAIEKERETETEFCLPKEVQKILHTLASQWEDVLDDKKLQVVQLGCHDQRGVPVSLGVEEGGEHRKGIDVFFDCEDKIRTFECMSKHGQGPRLLGHFPNGRVEEFVQATAQGGRGETLRIEHKILGRDISVQDRRNLLPRISLLINIK
ncbi:hypothetical protein EJ110_NYTH41105 [Nymphaea thermarum]|nr:hypothetical protein EJ110_NYTH41105 [Nymphaea thermarum]